MMNEVVAKRLRHLQQLRANPELFCAANLKIMAKLPGGGNLNRSLIPFKWNRAQKYAHARLEEQKAKTGKVRALILKGRQQGISTYVSARFYHRASLFKGTSVYILSHEQKSGLTLFSMASTYHKKNSLAPHTSVENKSEMEFDRLNSKYAVGTAGESEGGRSQNATHFHGSEVAFWRNATAHFASSVQTVADAPGTEIILESTANGPSGEFFERWENAVRGDGDYIAIFIPWFWQDEYAREVDETFELMDDGSDDFLSEKQYYEMFESDGCTLGHMAWRRAKIKELGSHAIFDQEYPGTAHMAFVTTATDNFIKALPVLQARKREREGTGPRIMGVDPSGASGSKGDRFAVAIREGLKVTSLTWRTGMSTMEGYNYVSDQIEQHQPDRVNIDAGGIGASIVSLLKDNLPPDQARLIHAVNFGSPSQFMNIRKQARGSGGTHHPDRKPGPINRRAEMHMRMREWLMLQEGADLPDLDELQGDLTATKQRYRLDNDIQLESKEEMRSRGAKSPDLADAIALTFATTTHIPMRNKGGKAPTSALINPDTARNVARSGQTFGSYGWMT